MPASKFRVELTPAQREELAALCRRQTAGAALVRRARILLLTDEAHPDGRRRDVDVAERVDLSVRQMARVRRRFAERGEGVPLTAAVDRKPRGPAPERRRLDGAAEARLVALACSTPPAGRDRWTLRLLAEEMGRLKIVESVCPETVRKALKKTS